jgi:hypothetical protein
MLHQCVHELRRAVLRVVTTNLARRFYPSEARKVAEQILAEELNGKEYDEDDAKEWSLTIAERVKAGVKGEQRRSLVTRTGVRTEAHKL